MLHDAQMKTKKGRKGTAREKKESLVKVDEVKTIPGKSWLINNFEEIGWLDPDKQDMSNYRGRPPMVNHEFDVLAYDESRFNPY